MSDSSQDVSTNVSVAAMVVAFVALVVASGQLLQQLFGTADGYRRCQHSVMGTWSKKTKRRWVWSEFRFETRYQTPHFVLFRDPGIHDRTLDPVRGKLAYAINSLDASRNSTLSPRENESFGGADVVSWTSLLQQLHELQARYLMPRAAMRNYIRETGDFYDISGLGRFEQDQSKIINMTSPAIEIRKRSWDLIPPDIHRPLATSTLGTIVCLAHRLGMSWITLRPSEGIMRAEGNGQSLAATPIRGLGVVLQYNFEKSVHERDPAEVVAAMRVPTTDADKMGCGIIPGDKKSFPGLWDIAVIHERSGRSVDSKLLSSAMERLEVLPETIQYIRDELADPKKKGRTPGFSDILGLWSGFMPLNSSHINAIIHPMGARLDSPFETREGRSTWRWVLSSQYAYDPNSLSAQQLWVMKQLNFLFNGYRNDFLRNRYLPRGNRMEDTKLLQSLRRIFDDTTTWFQLLDVPTSKAPAVAVSIFDDERSRLRTARKVDRFYSDLVASHISVAAFANIEAEENLRSKKVREDAASVLPSTFDPLLVEQSYIYCDNIEKVVVGMRKRGQIEKLGYIDTLYKSDDLVRDAWWTMMLRAVVWFMGNHRLEADEIPPVPSHYYDSSTTVYIT